MSTERESDLVALVRLQLRSLPNSSRLDHFTVNAKKDVRYVAQIASPHTEIDGFVSHFACSSRSMEHALELLLGRL